MSELEPGDSGSRRRVARWLVPVAASVAVLLVGLGTWLLLRPDTPAPVVANTTTTTVTLTDSPATTTPSSPETGPPAPAGTHALPVYYVGKGSTANPWLLYRTFLPAQPVASDPAAKASAAVTIALAGQDALGHSLTAYDGYQQPWQPGTSATTTVGANQIEVVLRKSGRSGLTADQQRISVQQLVWTATAAAVANLPVLVRTESGAAIFETIPGGVFRRPAATYEDLAPLWITEPDRYSPRPAGQPVVVRGQACVFEASFSWELSRDGGVVRSGNAMASSGCPERGTYSIDLGVLAVGQYSMRVFELSAADGSLFAESRAPFTISN